MSYSAKLVVTPIARTQDVIADIQPAVADGAARLGEENRRLRERLVRLTIENQRLSERLVAAEERGAGLVKLYTSKHRLDQASDRRGALDAIQEIIIGVVGCEEYAILEADEDGVGVELVASLGIDVRRLNDPSAGVIAEVMESGTSFFAPPRRTPAGMATETGEAAVTACVPMCAAGGRVVGAIVLYQLLPHKPALDQFDRSLLELLSVGAARSLLASAKTARA